jgi:hypothetical protein
MCLQVTQKLVLLEQKLLARARAGLTVSLETEFTAREAIVPSSQYHKLVWFAFIIMAYLATQTHSEKCVIDNSVFVGTP